MLVLGGEALCHSQSVYQGCCYLVGTEFGYWFGCVQVPPFHVWNACAFDTVYGSAKNVVAGGIDNIYYDAGSIWVRFDHNDFADCPSPEWSYEEEPVEPLVGGKFWREEEVVLECEQLCEHLQNSLLWFG